MPSSAKLRTQRGEHHDPKAIKTPLLIVSRRVFLFPLDDNDGYFLKKGIAMAKKTKKPKRDVEKIYSTKQTVAKLRRLADCLENGMRFQIQIGGERIAVPADAVFTIEHEREGDMEEIEFQFKWERK
jgi:amphi-Trp domain-containing protein